VLDPSLFGDPHCLVELKLDGFDALAESRDAAADPRAVTLVRATIVKAAGAPRPRVLVPQKAQEDSRPYPFLRS
jgi:hypothetical protein